MDTTLSVLTTKKNGYFYDIKKKEYLISHPLLIYFLKKEILEKRTLKDKDLPDKIEFEGYNFGAAQILYYFNKFRYLKEQGFFKKSNYVSLLKREVHPKDIESQIANTKHVVFEVTDLCNLKCKYCGYGELYNDYDERVGQKMGFENIKTIFDYLLSSWDSASNRSSKQLVHIGFYGGEPLININLIEKAVRYIEGFEVTNRKFIYNMTTNAFLLDKYMDFLVQKDFQLLISLDGDKDCHSYRVTHSGQNSFHKVYQNIKLLQKEYPDYFLSNVNFNSVLHNRNSLGQIHNFIYSEFGKVPRVNPLDNSGVREDMRDDFLRTFKNIREDLANTSNVKQLLKERFIDHPSVFRLALFLHWRMNNVYREYNDLIVDISNEIRLPTGTCLPFEKKIFVTVNGKIMACERINQQYYLGKIENNKVDINFEEVARMYNTHLDYIRKQCYNCYGADRCMQCIFQLDGLNSATKCHAFHNNKIFGDIISENIGFLEENSYLFNKILKNVIIK